MRNNNILEKILFTNELNSDRMKLSSSLFLKAICGVTKKRANAHPRHKSSDDNIKMKGAKDKIKPIDSPT